MIAGKYFILIKETTYRLEGSLFAGTSFRSLFAPLRGSGIDTGIRVGQCGGVFLRKWLTSYAATPTGRTTMALSVMTVVGELSLLGAVKTAVLWLTICQTATCERAFRPHASARAIRQILHTGLGTF